MYLRRREAKGKDIMAERSDQCDTELCLSPCGLPTRRPSPTDSLDNRTHQPAPSEKSGEQKLTIFYGGQMCVCDVTEIQAKTIIGKAKHEIEGVQRVKHHTVERIPAPTASRHMRRSLSMPAEAPPQLQLQQQQQQQQQLQLQLQLQSSFSMKRSLQVFLEKRKTRAHVESSSPPQSKQLP